MHRMLSAAIVSVVIALTNSGCAMLMTGDTDAAMTESQAEHVKVGKYTVELRPHDGESERVEVEFRGVAYVQQALEESGALRKFDRMKIELIRTANGRPQRMRSAYDHTRDQVPIEWDYAIYPGDRIIVTEDPSTIFDDMLESAFGPLSFLNAK